MYALQTEAAWAFPKNYPYLDAINYHLSEIISKGLSERLMIQQMDEKVAGTCDISPFNPISIESTLAAFIVLVLGVIVSVGILAFEKTRFVLARIS